MIKTTKDSRTIRTGKDYTAFRRKVFEDQRGRCMTCGMWTNLELPIEFASSFHIAHRGSRGMGGSIRDDVIGPNKGQVECGKCGSCHREDHHQGRSQVVGQYDFHRKLAVEIPDDLSHDLFPIMFVQLPYLFFQI